ncbi:ABC transporter substrate-binding protein [Rhodoferax saidenbachensis]|jgi:branched-chain amino acid transport system substrate-binding protein|uniref:ABC transporter substrate-binding protein n=1 Tax=Rhodoferax saidenbachensis TaxID=1484693 RepID=A0A1P8KEV5_9BURK|nr:ABC transporter substrate-binding protein [Rhodoferax saidenbachensis]APW44570.1 ABC transporter substrate-binding protein [Rhodoferax saidenbachensis]
MNKRLLLSSLVCAAFAVPLTAMAQAEPFRIGLILPMTGPFASTGVQINAAVKLYMAQNGSTVAGRKVEVILKDDAGIPDQTKRLAQELVVNDKVAVLAGFGITPAALSVGSIATQSKTPAVIMAAATSSIVGTSPYFVRTSYTLPQTAVTMAEWANKNKLKKFVTLVSDYGPGIDAEKNFKERVLLNGGQVVGELRVPMRAPDFAPFLQKVRDLSPDALFVFVPSGPATALMKQFAERGLDKTGIKLIGDGGVTDDDLLNEMGDVALGTVTSFHYSAAHDSPVNKKFVEAFNAANKGMRPNFMAVGGYDGMRVIYKALETTKGKGGGEALVAAMKGQIFESPRGPVLIDAQTRDIVQDVYIRRVERKNGQLWNVEIDVNKAVKDTARAN